MYYPYLRAKQYELKALREFSVENSEQNIITPILEPVKQQPNALNVAIDDMLDNNLKFALILNPHDGDFKHPTVRFNAWLGHEKLMEDKDAWIPAFIYSERNFNEISSIISKYELRNVMIIFRNCMDIDDSNAWSIVNNESVNYIVNYFGSNILRRLRKKLNETGKNIIRLDDCFKSRSRNADYALEVDEFFSEEPFYYDSESDLDGYSDYTTLPSEYTEGGMLPYALVIHLSYKKTKINYMFIILFQIQMKLIVIFVENLEKLQKIAPFYVDKYRTKAVEEIIEKAEDPNGYPGLGYLKKLSIKNHLELILSL